MIEVEKLLREGKINLPEINVFESETFGDPAYAPLGLTNSRRVKMYAERDAGKEFDENSKGWVLEFNAKLVYYAVFFGLYVDDKPAFQHVEKEAMESIIENVLGNHISEYTALGETILSESGIEFVSYEPPQADEETEEEADEEQVELYDQD